MVQKGSGFSLLFSWLSVIFCTSLSHNSVFYILLFFRLFFLIMKFSVVNFSNHVCLAMPMPTTSIKIVEPSTAPTNATQEGTKTMHIKVAASCIRVGTVMPKWNRSI